MSVRKKNNSKKADDKRTVSIRNMSLSVWHKAIFKCKIDKLNMADYVESLIKNDLKKSSR